MRILKILPYFTLSRGGPVVSALSQSRELSKRGHEVAIATTTFGIDDDLCKSARGQGVTMFPFKDSMNIGDFIISPSMGKWMKKNVQRYDVIHMHDFRSYQNNLSHHYAKRYGTPYVLQAHGSVLPFFQRVMMKRAYDVVWGQRVLAHARYLIALKRMEFDQYLRMGVGSDRVTIMPNAINLSDCSELPPLGQFKKKYGIEPDERIILFLGRIHRVKGIDLLVKAFSRAIKKTGDVRLAIVGPDCGYLASIRRLIASLDLDRLVVLTGPLHGKSKMEAYVDSDVYVLPSGYEIFGNTILEAVACGTPVITTDRCGLSDFVSNFGYVVRYEVDELEDAILRILDSREMKNRVIEKGWRTLEQEFNMAAIGAKLEETYEKAIDAESRSSFRP